MGVRSTVVVVTWRGRDHLGACLSALAAQTREHRVVVVDNASTDGSAGIAAGFGVETVRLARNVGYAGALASVVVDTEFVCWLNDDAVVCAGWLAALEAALDSEPGWGAAGGMLISEGGGVQSRGVGLTGDGYGRDVVGGVVFGFCGGRRYCGWRRFGGLEGFVGGSSVITRTLICRGGCGWRGGGLGRCRGLGRCTRMGPVVGWGRWRFIGGMSEIGC